MATMRAQLRQLRRFRDTSDRGVIIALTALLLIPLIGATGFAVDVGAWYAHATRIQSAADAAALAGVVWADDSDNPTKYDDVARATARKNGFVHNPPDTIVLVEKTTTSSVKVTITQDADQFFSSTFLDDQDIRRSAVAEYVQPIPLGSPRNFLGTGRMGYSGDSSSIYTPEGLTLSINGYCTAKNQGDRIASRYVSSENCSGTTNTEYDVPNYEFYIDIPTTRTGPVDVLLFDPGFQYSNRTSKGLPGGNTFASDFDPGNPSNSQSWMDTTFELFQADTTPLDDGDNQSMATLGACAASDPGADGHHTFDGNNSTLETNTSFFPSHSGTAFYNYSGWWNLCRIPTTQPAGRYILKVNNQTSPRNRGSNNFAIVAREDSIDRLCDSRVQASCPKVYAKDYLSVRGNTANTPGNVRAQFFLAEVEDLHAGKRLEVALWDPAEGGVAIRLLEPTGSNSWGYTRFDWESTDGASGSNTFSVPVSSNNFNGDLLTLSLDLPTDYTTPPANAWWKIEYEYTNAVTDRTTWSVSASGDPVHLTE